MPSLLRIVGVVVGLGILCALVWLGRRDSNRGLVLPLGIVGVGLLAVGLYPDVVRPVQDFFGLRDQPVGRLVTAIVVAVAISYLLVFYALAKSERNTQRLRRLIRALSAAQVEATAAGGRLGGVLVIVPAYNEAESLPAVLTKVPQTICGLPTHVLVVDDSSHDGTREAALAMSAHVVSHPVNGGQGSALQTGYLVAERLGVDVVVTMDADGQHDPNQIERLVQPDSRRRCRLCRRLTADRNLRERSRVRWDCPERRDWGLHRAHQPAWRHERLGCRERLSGDPCEPPGRDRVYRGPVPQPRTVARSSSSGPEDPEVPVTIRAEQPGRRRRAGRFATG